MDIISQAKSVWTEIGFSTRKKAVVKSLIMAVCFFAGLSFGYTETSLAESDRHFQKIGVVLPLTGPSAIRGIPMQNAAKLAAEESGRETDVQLIFEDDLFLPRNTVSAVHKLVMKDKVDALLVFGTNQGLAIVDFTEQHKVPLISVNVNRKVVKGRRHSVMLMPSLEDLTALNISVAKKRGYRRIAIIAALQDSCLMQKEILENSGDFDIVSVDEVSPLETEIRTVSTRIAARQPDAVFLSLLPPQGSLFSRELRELGFQGEMFGGLQIANHDEFRASQGALNEAWVVAGDDRMSDEYFSKYRARFNSEPTSESVYVYDGIRMIIEGSGTPDLNGYLHNLKGFKGYGGTYDSDGENGFHVPVVAKKYTEKGFQYID